MATYNAFTNQMIYVFFWLAGYGFLAWVLLSDRIQRSVSKQSRKIIACITLMVSLVIQLLIARFGKANDVDLGFFIHWGQTLADGGFYHFYSQVSFSDYPPGYFPVLWLLAKIQQCFSLQQTQVIYFLFKLPCILLLILAAAWIGRRSLKQNKSMSREQLCALALCAFSPCLWADVMWGQLDIVLSLLLAASLWFLTCNQPIPSALLFTLGFLVKPQGILMTPVYLCYIAKEVVCAIRKKQWNPLPGIAVGLVGSFALYTFFTMLFDRAKGNFWWILQLYFDDVNSYCMASLGAFNFYGFLGQVGKGTNVMIGFLTADHFSTLMIGVGVVLSAFICFVRKDAFRYLSGACVLYIWIYTFAVKMHERYLAPVILPLILLYVLSRKKFHVSIVLALSGACTVSIMRALISYWQNINTDNVACSIVFSGVELFAALAFTAYELWPGIRQVRTWVVKTSFDNDHIKELVKTE